MDLSNENVIHIKKNGIEFLQFRKLLEYKEIKHAYSLGVDKKYKLLKEEEKLQVMENYKKLCNEIGTDYVNISKPIQTHTGNVKVVENKLNKDKPDFEEMDYNEIDGLITNKKHIILSTTNADCILMLFYDPVKKVIANVHSGWRGTVQRISVKIVEKMKKEFNCNAEDIICCICPSIRKCHFEVERDVKEIFEKEFSDLMEDNDIIEEKIEDKKWNIDTVLINKIILKRAGLNEGNIIDSGICSVCNSQLIHSYRVEEKNYNANTALIELN